MSGTNKATSGNTPVVIRFVFYQLPTIHRYFQKPFLFYSQMFLRKQKSIMMTMLDVRENDPWPQQKFQDLLPQQLHEVQQSTQAINCNHIPCFSQQFRKHCNFSRYVPPPQNCRSNVFLETIKNFIQDHTFKDILTKSDQQFQAVIEEFIKPVIKRIDEWKNCPDICQKCKMLYDVWRVDHDKQQFYQIINQVNEWLLRRQRFLRNHQSIKRTLFWFEESYECKGK